MTLKNTFDIWNAKLSKTLFLNMGMTERRRLWGKLANYLKNGMSLLKALRTLRTYKSMVGQTGSPGEVALASWIDSLEGGSTLHHALNGWVSSDEIMLISAGEQSGKLVQTLKSVETLMESKSKIRSALIKGLTYPFFLILLSLGTIYGYGAFVVPMFNKMTHNHQWQGWAQIMFVIGGFVANWAIPLAILFVFLIIAFFMSLTRFDGRLRVYLDQHVPYAIYRVITGTSFLTALAALVAAKIGVKESLSRLSRLAQPTPEEIRDGAANKTTNKWLKNRLDAAYAGVDKGDNIAVALAEAGHKFPDLEVINDLAAYADYAGFDEALAKTGEAWLETAVQNIESQTAVLFAVSIMSVIAILIAIIAAVASLVIQWTQTMGSMNSFSS